MKTPPIVSPKEWEAARQELLVREKELTRARDALAAERRRMPWLAVDKAYEFDGPEGRVSLLDLFAGRRQLIVYRAFYGPEVTTYAEGGAYPERACVGCSFVADHFDGGMVHLNQRPIWDTWKNLVSTVIRTPTKSRSISAGQPQTTLLIALLTVLTPARNAFSSAAAASAVADIISKLIIYSISRKRNLSA